MIKPSRSPEGKPKGYLSDTGLSCFLMRLSSPQAVQGHPAFGALLESLVATECWKQLQEQSLVPVVYHFRQHSGAEVNLILEKDELLCPVEIKASSQARPSEARSIHHIFQEKIGSVAQPGLMIYGGSKILRLSETCAAVPFDLVPA